MFRISCTKLIFQAAGVVFVILMIWCVNESTSIFSWLAKLFRWIFVDANDGDIFAGQKVNMPFLGRTYYHSLLDIMMHLLGGFLLYALFTSSIIQGYVEARKEWKAIEESGGNMSSASAAFRRHEKLYHKHEEAFKSYLASTSNQQSTLQ